LRIAELKSKIPNLKSKMLSLDTGYNKHKGAGVREQGSEKNII
jgi:hypothetical protein